MKFQISYASDKGPVSANLNDGDFGDALKQVFGENGFPTDGHEPMTLTASNGDSIKLLPNKPDLSTAIDKANAWEQNEALKRVRGKHTRATSVSA